MVHLFTKQVYTTSFSTYSWLSEVAEVVFLQKLFQFNLPLLYFTIYHKQLLRTFRSVCFYEPFPKEVPIVSYYKSRTGMDEELSNRNSRVIKENF